MLKRHVWEAMGSGSTSWSADWLAGCGKVIALGCACSSLRLYAQLMCHDLSAEYIFNDDGSLVPDFSKCTTTKDQLNNAVYWDEYLDWMYRHMSEYSLSEWSQEYLNKLYNSFEVFRPKVPVGVISYESEEEWHYQNKNKESVVTGRDEIDAQNFVESSIFNWIYRNSNLVDLKGNDLNKSVASIFKQ